MPGELHPGAIAAVAAIMATGLAAAGDVVFEEVSARRGIGAYEMALGFAGGVAAADYDDDGDVDLFVPQAFGSPDLLYRNDGAGAFEEIASDVGLDSTARSRGALWLDVDGDHRLDLVVAGDCFQDEGLCGHPAVRLFRQQPDGTFVDTTEAAGLSDVITLNQTEHLGGLVAGDLDGNGFLDLYVGYWKNEALVLLNDGAGGFVNAGTSSGIGGIEQGHWQAALHDFDGDGRLDVFAAIDFEPNHLWLNGGDGTFDDVAESAGVDTAWNDMGITLGDYDNDGDLDVFVTEITVLDQHNVLYRNDTVGGTPVFAEVATEAGIASTGFGWGATFFDADLDGRLDLAVTNGWFNGVGYDDPSRFFRNAGGTPVVFADESGEAGIDDQDWGSALVAVDLDRDGDRDLVQTCNLGGPLRVLDNAQSSSHHAITLRPRMDGPNHRAIGAIVRVAAGGLVGMFPITAGTSLLGQEPAEAHFGLGASVTVDRVVIEWPDGRVTTAFDLGADQVVTLWADGMLDAADLDADGDVDGADLGALLASWGSCDGCAADVDLDGVVDGDDLSTLLSTWGAR